MDKKLSVFVLAASSAMTFAFAGDSVADKPTGFRFFNNHLTVKPYVSLSYTYDSNADTARHSDGYSIFMVSPAADFEWKGERWSLVGSLFYSYSAYSGDSDQLNNSTYGESLKYNWTTSKPGEKGWSLALSERYAYIAQNDALNSGDGRGIWRDRQRFDASGVIERRFTERWHADLSGQYDWLDYKNDTGKYAPLYGWQEFSAGLEAGFAASKWTDLLVAGGYSGYRQKSGSGGYRNYSNESQVWTVMGGFGTHATEKIQYRLLAGASWLEYGGHSGADSGWTYQLSANWRVTRQVQLSLLGSSYYQPSERTCGSAIKVYSISAGASYLTLGDKLNLRGDIAFRREDNVYSDKYLGAGNDYDEDILSVRLGATYTINRWVSVFANISWEEEWCDSHKDYDYDRYRGTVGLRFHY
jgi:hypothetical protein